jgi:4-amino-4-deoxychorismate lyase
VSAWFRDGTAVTGLPLEDRSWQYGDGLFETIAVRAGKPRLCDWHLERLTTGCRRLGIEPPSRTRLEEDVAAALVAAREDTDFALVKIVVTAGPGPRGYARRSARPGCYVGVFPANRLDPAAYRDGVAVRLCATRLAHQPQLAGIKSLNRLEQVLARNEWTDAGIFEGLTCDTAGNLICGTMSNVFILGPNSFLTPDLSQCGVGGIMRRKVVETAERAGLTVEVTTLDRRAFQSARSIFLTNSQFGLLPVRRLDDRHFDIDTTVRQLMSLLAADGFPEIAC